MPHPLTFAKKRLLPFNRALLAFEYMCWKLRIRHRSSSPNDYYRTISMHLSFISLMCKGSALYCKENILPLTAKVVFHRGVLQYSQFLFLQVVDASF